MHITKTNRGIINVRIGQSINRTGYFYQRIGKYFSITCHHTIGRQLNRCCSRTYTCCCTINTDLQTGIISSLWSQMSNRASICIYLTSGTGKFCIGTIRSSSGYIRNTNPFQYCITNMHFPGINNSIGYIGHGSGSDS